MSITSIASVTLLAGGFTALLGAMGNPVWLTNVALGSLATIAGAGIGMGVIGVMFHELTHVYGGNFRRKQQELNELK